MTRQPLITIVPGRPPQVAPAVWAVVTVQAAWTLLSEGVRLSPEVLAAAREHALLGLRPGSAPGDCADAAVSATRRFVAAARLRGGASAEADVRLLPLSSRWRRGLERCLDPVGDLVLREHYANQRPLAELARVSGRELDALEGARAGLREVLRAGASRDGLPVERWSVEDLDVLLQRLAVYPLGDCPPVADVLDGADGGHAARCVPCERARRLVRAGALTPEDLMLTASVPWPAEQVRALVLHLHPDARRVRPVLRRELPGPCVPLEDDLLVVDLARAVDVHRVLVLGAEAGLPSRAHLRGAVLAGPGRWSRHGLLGPLAAEARDRVRATPWGVVEGLGELPAPLPPPPSARPMWTGVVALAALTLAVGWAVAHPASAREGRLDPTFTPGRGGVWTEIDVDDRAVVAVVRQAGGRLDLVLEGQDPAEKAPLAVGDGTYRLHTMGEGVLVVAGVEPVEELPALVAAAGRGARPLDELASRIRRAAPGADIVAYTRP